MKTRLHAFGISADFRYRSQREFERCLENIGVMGADMRVKVRSCVFGRGCTALSSSSTLLLQLC